jgi:hypothetical protein
LGDEFVGEGEVEVGCQHGAMVVKRLKR